MIDAILISLLSGWAVMSFLMTLSLAGKPATFTFQHKRKEIHAPVGRFLVCGWVVAFVMVSIIPHIAFRLVGCRGFYNKVESSYTTQNPFKRTER